MYATNYFEEKVLNAFRGITYTAPSKVFLDLYITPVGEDGSGTAVSYPGYARKEILFSAPASLNGGIGVQNENEIEFVTAGIDGATITHAAIFDSLAGGNMLLYGELLTPIQVLNGVAPTVRVGEVKFWATGSYSAAFRARVFNTLRGINLNGFAAYASLYSGNPENGGNELTGGGFERVEIPFGAPAEGAGGNCMIQNSVQVSFPVAAQTLGIFDYDVICDGKTGGIPVSYLQATAAVYSKGDEVRYPAGEIKVGLN